MTLCKISHEGGGGVFDPLGTNVVYCHDKPEK
jgi:hypothetical protein